MTEKDACECVHALADMHCCPTERAMTISDYLGPHKAQEALGQADKTCWSLWTWNLSDEIACCLEQSHDKCEAAGSSMLAPPGGRYNGLSTMSSDLPVPLCVTCIAWEYFLRLGRSSISAMHQFFAGSVPSAANLVAPLFPRYRQTISAIPHVAFYGVFGVSTWPIRCDNPSSFSEPFPLAEQVSGGAITTPPHTKEVSQRYLCDTTWKQGKIGATPPLRYYLEKELRDMGGYLAPGR